MFYTHIYVCISHISGFKTYTQIGEDLNLSKKKKKKSEDEREDKLLKDSCSYLTHWGKVNWYHEMMQSLNGSPLQPNPFNI